MILWTPRVILTRRLFRLPVGGDPDHPPTLDAPGFDLVDHRWSPRDQAWMFYLRTPASGGDYPIAVTSAPGATSRASTTY